MYTNFVNLLDLAAVAVPAGFTPEGLPGGVTLDRRRVAGRAAARARGARCTRRRHSPPAPPRCRCSCEPEHDWLAGEARIPIVVCGAHLSGLPLNPQLTSRGAAFVRAARSAPEYRLLARCPAGCPSARAWSGWIERGAAIEVEVWSLPEGGFGSFVAATAPLSIGKVKLDDGTALPGFICESVAVAGALRHHAVRWLARLPSGGRPGSSGSGRRKAPGSVRLPAGAFSFRRNVAGLEL